MDDEQKDRIVRLAADLATLSIERETLQKKLRHVRYETDKKSWLIVKLASTGGKPT